MSQYIYILTKIHSDADAPFGLAAQQRRECCQLLHCRLFGRRRRKPICDKMFAHVQSLNEKVVGQFEFGGFKKLI